MIAAKCRTWRQRYSKNRTHSRPTPLAIRHTTPRHRPNAATNRDHRATAKARRHSPNMAASERAILGPKDMYGSLPGDLPKLPWLLLSDVAGYMIRVYSSLPRGLWVTLLGRRRCSSRAALRFASNFGCPSPQVFGTTEIRGTLVLGPRSQVLKSQVPSLRFQVPGLRCQVLGPWS